MYVKEFVETITKYANEIGCDGKGNISSHKISSSIRVTNVDSDDEYEIVGFDIDRLMGCGCWCGIEIQVRKIEN